MLLRMFPPACDDVQSVAALLTTLLPQLAERSDPELHEVCVLHVKTK